MCVLEYGNLEGSVIGEAQWLLKRSIARQDARQRPASERGNCECGEEHLVEAVFVSFWASPRRGMHYLYYYSDFDGLQYSSDDVDTNYPPRKAWSDERLRRQMVRSIEFVKKDQSRPRISETWRRTEGAKDNMQASVLLGVVMDDERSQHVLWSRHQW